MMSFESLLKQFQQHDRQALARLLTFIARGEHVDAIRKTISGLVAAPFTGAANSAPVKGAATGAKVIALTGSGGVGKSTLIGKLIEHIRAKGQTVAVLACDPQSPISGGALLGDRFRMPSRPDDPGVFVRSLAAPGGREAVAEHVETMIDLLAAFGFDHILLETVGAGQGDTAVRHLADVVVLLLQPETGDDLQWEKAGVLEVADIIAVHKGDLPGAERVEAQVRALLNLPDCRQVPVIRVSSSKDQGVDALWELINQQSSRRLSAEHNGRELLQLAQQQLARRFAEQSQRIQPVLERWKQGELDDSHAIAELFRTLAS